MSGWHPMPPWRFWESDQDEVIGSPFAPPGFPPQGYPAGYAGPDILVDPDFGIINPEVMREAREGDLPFNPRGGSGLTAADLRSLDHREDPMDGYAIMGASIGIDAGEFAASLASGLAAPEAQKRAAGTASADVQAKAAASAQLEAARLETARKKKATVIWASVLGGLVLVIGGVVVWLIARRRG